MIKTCLFHFSIFLWSSIQYLTFHVPLSCFPVSHRPVIRVPALYVPAYFVPTFHFPASYVPVFWVPVSNIPVSCIKESHNSPSSNPACCFPDACVPACHVSAFCVREFIVPVFFIPDSQVPASSAWKFHVRVLCSSVPCSSFLCSSQPLYQPVQSSIFSPGRQAGWSALLCTIVSPSMLHLFLFFPLRLHTRVHWAGFDPNDSMESISIKDKIFQHASPVTYLFVHCQKKGWCLHTVNLKRKLMYILNKKNLRW